MKRAPRLAPLCLLAAAAATLCACASDPHSGYAFASVHDESIKTVHVPIFQNKTFSHDLEFLLTDAIIKEIQRATPWRVTSSEYAQTTLTGEITGAQLQDLSTQRVSGLAQELNVALTINFQFKDNRTGKVIAARRDFSAAESFVPAHGVGERIEVGQDAAIQRLAKQVVAALRSNW